MYVSTATCASGQRIATAASIRFGPHASTMSVSGTADTAVPAKPREPSSVAQITSSPSASEQSSSTLRAPCTQVTLIPAARASRAASGIGATPSPPLTSATERGPGESSKPWPRGPRQLIVSRAVGPVDRERAPQQRARRPAEVHELAGANGVCDLRRVEREHEHPARDLAASYKRCIKQEHLASTRRWSAPPSHPARSRPTRVEPPRCPAM